MRPRELTAIEQLGAMVPGYVGYADRDSLRQTDKAIRMHIYDALVQAEHVIESKLRLSTNESQRVELAQLETSRKEIDTLAARYKYAARGESGYFADFRVTQEELTHVCNIDLEVVEQLTNLQSAVEEGNAAETSKVLEGFARRLDARTRFLRERK